MSLITTMKCDGEKCGELRVNDSNHWLQGVAFNDAVLISLSTVKLEARYYDHPVQPENVHHFCGQECAMKWASQEIAKLRS